MNNLKIVLFSLIKIFAIGISLCIAIIVVFLYTSTMRPNISIEEAMPWGTWESHDPPIVLHINPNYRMSVQSYFTCPALFKDIDRDIKIFVDFNTRGGMIGRYRPHFMRIFCRNNSIPLLHSNDNGFQVIDDKLHFTTRSENHEYIIIFHRLEEYEPINRRDWLLPPFQLSPALSGTWESTEPNIILHLDANILHEGDGVFHGEYTSNGNTINASVLFTRTHPTFLNIIFPREYGISPLGGNFRVVDDELHFTLLPPIQEETGFNLCQGFLESYFV